jgi:ribulose-bisphosphate carboxylase large chain
MISQKDIPGFFADKKDLKAEDYVLLTYRFETEIDPKAAAANLCCEQSTAQWARPGRDEDFRALHGAKVIELESRKGDPAGRPYHHVVIAHPHRNFGPRIPNFLSAAAGEGPFYCPGIHWIKWTDFDFPKTLLSRFEGPQFGLKGLRETTGIQGRPFFVGVVKPNIGLKPHEFAEIAFEAWKGGLDIAKDDEMLADADGSPLVERVLLTAGAMKKAESQTGEKKIYITNITDEVDEIVRLHDESVERGANAVMVNAIMTGISALRALRRKASVPIMSHFTGTAVFSRVPNFGISSLVAAKLQRLAGADIIGLAGFGERMGCSDDEVLANIKACLEPWGTIKPALPIPGGSDTPETLPKVFGKVGHPDFGFICGRGVFGHPRGPAAGARALREAWNKISPR